MQNDNALESLKHTLKLRENELAELELQLTTLQQNLNEFEILYRKHLSKHYARLDALKLDILELAEKYQKGLVSQEELEEARNQAQKSNQEYQDCLNEDKPEVPNKEFKPTESLKELYRKAVKLMHPDLANSPEENTLRTSLLSKINEAYTHGREEAIREILDHWQQTHALNLNTNNEIAIVSRRILLADKSIEKIRTELRAIRKDKLFALWQAYQTAKGEGRNLLEEIEHGVIQETMDILTDLKKLAR
jgi:hypothetical protein